MGDLQTEAVPAPPPALGAATMCEALLATAALRPDKVAVRTPDDSLALTYAQLTRRIAATASLLHDLGLRRGDALAIMLVNRPEFHVVDAAAMMLGATPFSLYNTSPAEQIAFVMGDAGNRLVVTEPRFADVVGAAGADARTLLLDDLAEGDESFDLERHWRAVGPDDLLTLIYTSGTTGPPKGVELTHANMLAELRGVHAAVPIESGGRWVLVPALGARRRPLGLALLGAHDLRPHGHLRARPHAGHGGRRPGAADRVRRRAARVGEAQGRPGGLGRGGARRPTSCGPPSGSTRRAGSESAPRRRPSRSSSSSTARGMPICEVWGMSEASCIVTTNSPGRMRFGSVGLPIDGHGALDRRRRRAARPGPAGHGRLPQPPRPHRRGDRRRRLAAHRGRRCASTTTASSGSSTARRS